MDIDISDSPPHMEALPSVTMDEPTSSVLPSAETLRIFWLDAYEDREIAFGSVFVFGKIQVGNNQYESISLRVQDLDRTLFFKLRPGFDEGEGLTQAFYEIDKLRSYYNIPRATMKPVRRRYAFEIPDIPEEAVYIKFQYSSKHSAAEVKPGETFSHVFGANTSLIELLLTRIGIKGRLGLE